MTRRLATICLVTVFVIGIPSLVVQADDGKASTATLSGISAVSVLVDSSDSAQILGLTEETIRIDVELKLRLAGMRVVTSTEIRQVPGSPIVHVSVTLLRDARAAYIEVELVQDAQLARNDLPTPSVSTWSTGILTSNPTVQGTRDRAKDLVDQFLNAWLSVNPKK